MPVPLILCCKAAVTGGALVGLVDSAIQLGYRVHRAKKSVPSERFANVHKEIAAEDEVPNHWQLSRTAGVASRGLLIGAAVSMPVAALHGFSLPASAGCSLIAGGICYFIGNRSLRGKHFTDRVPSGLADTVIWTSVLAFAADLIERSLFPDAGIELSSCLLSIGLGVASYHTFMIANRYPRIQIRNRPLHFTGYRSWNAFLNGQFWLSVYGGQVMGNLLTAGLFAAAIGNGGFYVPGPSSFDYLLVYPASFYAMLMFLNPADPLVLAQELRLLFILCGAPAIIFAGSSTALRAISLGVTTLGFVAGVCILRQAEWHDAHVELERNPDALEDPDEAVDAADDLEGDNFEPSPKG